MFRYMPRSCREASAYNLRLALGEPVLLRNRSEVGCLRLIEADEAGIGTFCPVHGGGAQAHDQTEHARRGIDIVQELVRAVGITDAGGAGHEVRSVGGTGNAHDKQRHLLVPAVQAAALAVVEGGESGRAGVDGTDSIFKFFEPFLRRTAVGAEHRLVLSGKGIVETVLQDTAGANDIGILAVVLQDMHELLLGIRGE